MTNNHQRRSTKRATSKQPRKNARKDESVIVIPKGGVEELKAKIGDPFSPMDFRKLLDQARQDDPANIDDAFEKIVEAATSQQANTLLRRLGIDSNNPDARSSAFEILATALCGVGQIAWSPPPHQIDGWNVYNKARLFWLVKAFCDKEKLSEQEAIRRIASDEFLHKFFPYRPQKLRRDARHSEQERKTKTLWQAWMKVKRQKETFLAAGPPELADLIVGRNLGLWESKLIALDTGIALPPAGKNRAR